MTSPSTNYFNANPLPAEEIYALVRDSSGTVLEGVEVTITAYAISGYTAVSGGLSAAVDGTLGRDSCGHG